ncbi:YceI family protein [Stenotrophomonas oahuensis]|uniref:YceI family protein n=1 Tax=Stenotrophomonas oahuensis TaxID=3003271 RepID=A0ABY9YRN5_9GAMM|nr:YceI family protein [Stenotrophomonas sp. A5586]WNH53090.1 YceI family protein [Stenotrophomonas sp. A5586]
MTIKLTSPAAVAAALAGLMAATPVLAADYVQAPGAGSHLAFATKYDGEVFTGSFPGFTTTVSFDPANPAAGKLDVTIPLARAVSGNSDRDSTLQGADFFNVAKFATARYTASGFTKTGENEYVAKGTLELRGVSKPVTFTFEWKDGANPVLKGKATVKRLDFGVGGGDWADTKTIPDETAISTVVTLKAK